VGNGLWPHKVKTGVSTDFDSLGHDPQRFYRIVQPSPTIATTRSCPPSKHFLLDDG
jgi:hypothetical protein